MWPDAGADRTAKIGIAVSGGPDSLALLLLAHAALPGRVEAATVDHGLRAESADEARHVAAICDGLGVRHRTLQVDVAQGNLQSNARATRYEALADWMTEHGIAALATGHHADDQAETLMMRLNRGSGVAGLAGIRETTNVPETDLALVRPLLHWRRKELAEVVEHAGLAAISDPSNHDEVFDRVRIRKALAEADWLNPLALAQSAQTLAEADEALSVAAQQERDANLTVGVGEIVYRPAAPRAVQLRVVAWVIAQFSEKELRGQAVAALLNVLERGESGNVAGVLASVERDVWVFREEPPRGRRG